MCCCYWTQWRLAGRPACAACQKLPNARRILSSHRTKALRRAAVICYLNVMQFRQLLIIASFALTAAHVSAEDWPEFRGPTGQGLSTARGLPLEWSATKNVAWK